MATARPAGHADEADHVAGLRRFVGHVVRQVRVHGVLVAETLSGLKCQLPLSGGTVAVAGNVQNPMARGPYSLDVSAKDLPAQALVVLLRHVKQDLPSDLAARGSLQAAFTLHKDSAGQAWAGTGTLSEVELRSSTLTAPVSLGDVSFVLEGPGTQHLAPVLIPAIRKGRLPIAPTLAQKVITLRPFTVPLGGAAPATVQAWFSSSGYSLEVQGEGRVQRLLQVARGLGLRAPQTSANGSARFDLRFAGNWFGFAAPTATGTAQLRAVTAPLRGVAAPLQISFAELLLTPQDATLQKVAAGFSGTHVALSGWIRLPRGCESLGECPARFELSSDQLSTDELNHLLNPRERHRPWYAVLARRDSSLFSTLHAEGRLSIGRLLVKSVIARRVVAGMTFDSGKVAIRNIRADLFGGVLRFDLWFAIPFTLFWIVGMINTVNWLDGIDGLASGIVAIAGIATALDRLLSAAVQLFAGFGGGNLGSSNGLSSPVPR